MGRKEYVTESRVFPWKVEGGRVRNGIPGMIHPTIENPLQDYGNLLVGLKSVQKIGSQVSQHPSTKWMGDADGQDYLDNLIIR